MLFLVVVVAEDVDQQSKRGSFPLRSRRKDEKTSLIAQWRHFGDEDIDWAALPTRILVEGPAGLLQTFLLGELVGALNENSNVFLCAHGTGDDGAVLTSRRLAAFLCAESRRGHHKGQEHWEIVQSVFHDFIFWEAGQEVKVPLHPPMDPWVSERFIKVSRFRVRNAVRAC